MKRIILLVFVVIILNGCGQSTSFLGPSYTLAKSGSAAQTGSSIAASYGFKKALNEPGVSYLLDTNPRECQTLHSSELNKVFFSNVNYARE